MTRTFLVVIACLTAACVYAHNDYEDVRHARKANIQISGLQPTKDGEHYAIRKGNDILLCSYTDRADTLVLLHSEFRIADFTLSPDEKSLLFADAGSVKPIYRHSYTADYWLSTGDYTQKVLDNVRDVSFSPNGRFLSFARNNNLYLYNISSAETTQITSDGEWNAIINGTSDWVYEEEYGFTKAYSFSTDSSQIAYLRFDESQVSSFEMMFYKGSLYNRAYSFKYPKAGEANSIVELWIYDIKTGVKSKVNVGNETDQYIFNPAWTPNGELYFYRINRRQNHFEVVLAHRDGSTKVIYNETSPRYVERPDNSTVTFIDKTRFVVREETTAGNMHLYLHSVNSGRINAVTKGNWEVTEIVAATDKQIYYISTEQSPLCRDFYTIDLNGKHKRRLTSATGFHKINPSNGMKYYVQTFSNTTTPNIITVHRNNGQVIDTLVDCRKSVMKYGDWAQRNIYSFTTERGDTLNYYIQLPSDFNPKKRYPLLITQYSGPGSQQVYDKWALDFFSDVMTRKGYIVACCDGRGTGFRGEDFKKCTYGNLGKLETEDQISFATMLSELPYVDADRIGIYGWSYGGFMALNCAIHGNGLFKMAIAVAPVTSWRYYDTIYTETYNGLPADNPDGYDANSPLLYADKLSSRTRLLIIHGTADDNVHFQNSMEMCRALNRSGKQYDMMVYPDQNHSMLPDCIINIGQKMIDFTSNNL